MTSRQNCEEHLPRCRAHAPESLQLQRQLPYPSAWGLWGESIKSEVGEGEGGLGGADGTNIVVSHHHTRGLNHC
jgi:hypothetical protein